MNIVGEYLIQYNIFTMFDVYNVIIKNKNLITDKGYEFFLEKWYKEDNIPFVLGYYHENNFYENYGVDGTYGNALKIDGSYDSSIKYIDKNTYKEYVFDGENFVSAIEKLDKICIGDCIYSVSNPLKPSENDNELYSPVNEYEIEDFVIDSTKLLMKYQLNNGDLDNTTEIGVKTNHGRLVSHDIHPPYNLPFESDITLEYVFKLK